METINDKSIIWYRAFCYDTGHGSRTWEGSPWSSIHKAEEDRNIHCRNWNCDIKRTEILEIEKSN